MSYQTDLLWVSVWYSPGFVLILQVPSLWTFYGCQFHNIHLCLFWLYRQHHAGPKVFDSELCLFWCYRWHHAGPKVFDSELCLFWFYRWHHAGPSAAQAAPTRCPAMTLTLRSATSAWTSSSRSMATCHCCSHSTGSTRSCSKLDCLMTNRNASSIFKMTPLHLYLCNIGSTLSCWKLSFHMTNKVFWVCARCGCVSLFMQLWMSFVLFKMWLSSHDKQKCLKPIQVWLCIFFSMTCLWPPYRWDVMYCIVSQWSLCGHLTDAEIWCTALFLNDLFVATL